MEAFSNAGPKREDNLALLGLLYTLMRELRSRRATRSRRTSTTPRTPRSSSTIPKIQKDKYLTQFVCDYVRLIIIGNAAPTRSRA